MTQSKSELSQMFMWIFHNTLIPKSSMICGIIWVYLHNLFSPLKWNALFYEASSFIQFKCMPAWPAASLKHHLMSSCHVVLHHCTEDCVQPDEHLSDCCVWSELHVLPGLHDTADASAQPARLLHHLDGIITKNLC